MSRRKNKLTRVEELIQRHGGAYRADNVFFHLYTNARLTPALAERRTFTVGVVVDSPPGPPQDNNPRKRADYWKQSKRLQHGSLVALVVVSHGGTRVYLGVVMSMSDEIARSALESRYTIQLRVSFFDTEVALKALRREELSRDHDNFALLVDGNIMFDSIRPFLQTLQDIEPTSIPFGHIIAKEGGLGNVEIQPPRYARVPGFRFNLQCLAKSGSYRIQNFCVQRGAEVSRRELQNYSTLDPSQVEAIISTLSQEISLIQG